jgi:hypothetical protein
MKHFFLFAVILTLVSSALAQEQKDSAAVSKKSKFGLSYSVFGSGPFDIALTAQSEIAVNIFLKKHRISAGVLFGPTYYFIPHRTGGLVNSKVEFYSLTDVNFDKFAIHGGVISYQYFFSIKKHLRHSWIVFAEYSKYEIFPLFSQIPPHPFPSINTKRQMHILTGYSFGVVVSPKFTIELNFMSGAKYYWDEQKDNPNDPYSAYSISSYEKLRGTFVIGLGLQYQR